MKGEGGRDAAVFHGTIQRHTLAGSYPKGKGGLQVNELNGLWRGKLPVSAILAKNLKIVPPPVGKNRLLPTPVSKGLQRGGKPDFGI